LNFLVSLFLTPTFSQSPKIYQGFPPYIS
jgi:hypothetical protein